MGTKRSKLFILGNGFDIAHGLPTRYSHFRKYLEQIQGVETNEFDNRNRASIITYFDRRCDGEDWKDIEYALGLFPLYLEGYNPEIDDRKEKEKYVFYQSSLLLEVIHAFRRWVNSISIDDAKPKHNFTQIINGEDFAFLTFNYTPILEKIYNIRETAICHIHGKQGDQVVMGHNRRDDDSIDFWLLADVAPYLRQEFYRLFKDPLVNITHNQNFFDSLADLTDIYSYGFSFSEPDREYIELICEKTTERTMWHLSSFDPPDVQEEYKKIINACGFRGTTTIFTA